MVEMKKYEPQNAAEIELALEAWRMGELPAHIIADMIDLDPDDEYLKRIDTGMAHVFMSNIQNYGLEVLTLLELWCGYVEVSEEEGTEATVEDFILATYHALRQ